MKTKRIIPCLDIKDGSVVKGINFNGIKAVADPVDLARVYYEQGADELVLLDISATNEHRGTIKSIVKLVSEQIFIPFTVGGGIRNIDDIKEILRSGADKVSLNSAAVSNPQLIKEASEYYGAQCIVIAIDAKRREDNSGWNVYVHGGMDDTGIDAVQWAKKAENLGCGEILLTSIDKDGMTNGFDIELNREISKSVSIPVIASGGCGDINDFYDVFKLTDVDAALAASIFHYGKYSVQDIKKDLESKNINVRI